MGRGPGCRRGEILSLREFLTEHGEAVEYDLLTHGLDLRLLGTDRLTWRRLVVFVNQAATDERSALWRDLAGDNARWDTYAQLLGVVAHATQVVAWQQTEDAKKKPFKHYPKPLGPKVPDESANTKPRLTLAALHDFEKRTTQRAG